MVHIHFICCILFVFFFCNMFSFSCSALQNVDFGLYFLGFFPFFWFDYIFFAHILFCCHSLRHWLAMFGFTHLHFPFVFFVRLIQRCSFMLLTYIPLLFVCIMIHVLYGYIHTYIHTMHMISFIFDTKENIYKHIHCIQYTDRTVFSERVIVLFCNMDICCCFFSAFSTSFYVNVYGIVGKVT